MTKRYLPHFLLCTVLLLMHVFCTSSSAQGTITFAGWAGWSGTAYQDQGLRFDVVVPAGTSGHDGMAIIVGGGNTPYNGTAFMGWFRQFNPYNYVSLSLTNGSLFGLTSVDLADPTAPSPSPVSISFVGYLAGGGSIANTFNTPGNGANTFQSYTFNSAFALPVFTHVDILAPRWAMDNLVFVVPEPATGSLAVLGLFVFAARWCHRGKGP